MLIGQNTWKNHAFWVKNKQMLMGFGPRFGFSGPLCHALGHQFKKIMLYSRIWKRRHLDFRDSCWLSDLVLTPGENPTAKPLFRSMNRRTQSCAPWRAMGLNRSASLVWSILELQRKVWTCMCFESDHYLLHRSLFWNPKAVSHWIRNGSEHSHQPTWHHIGWQEQIGRKIEHPLSINKIPWKNQFY